MTKALSMKMVNKTRKAYRSYARTLVEHGLLDDTDQIYFLTREEIRRLIADRDPRVERPRPTSADASSLRPPSCNSH
jgi:hypothetical protein